MGYVAMKPMKIDGRRVNPGDPLPGAENWKHLHALISQGYVAGYPDQPAEKKGNGKKGQQQRRAASQAEDGHATGGQDQVEAGGESGGVDVQR
ncbi:MAG: hypothetical protein K6T81_04340 [Alicyclobacillus macrosporangiidus]|uniref:hypothetical protein n=1 Tax=Alicyclobacillus macrosporangiidus TaxID=392015 RepID=UPI0026ED4D62|nr:hypothetical protein [Alicyclobacillus macrosporangiidus]MCL6597948.1 hypothetical protein [Alicyclobacillus macrosporangiidus]